MSQFLKETSEIERCVYCNQALAIMEQNRSECWECREKMSETYSDEHSK
ncbi:hypothetical protein IEC97_00840 [Neobacillus cucumis]|nr:hypothetical protein [Neobacillus cucumis]MBI0575890.1 hypothetical protein [Neobacillus cucumis]WHY90085.1 hypothetical protein QNK12_20725 [Neobacillus cucumis]